MLAADVWRDWADDVRGQLGQGDEVADARAETLIAHPRSATCSAGSGPAPEHTIPLATARDLKSTVRDIIAQLGATTVGGIRRLTAVEAGAGDHGGPGRGEYYPREPSPPPAPDVPSLKRTRAALSAVLPVLRVLRRPATSSGSGRQR